MSDLIVICGVRVWSDTCGWWRLVFVATYLACVMNVVGALGEACVVDGFFETGFDWWLGTG